MPSMKSANLNIHDLGLTIEALLALAKAEQWDDLLLAWPGYELLTLNLTNICWASIPEDEVALLETQLRQIETNHSQLLELTSAWRDELQDILQNTVQSRKLNDHYR